MKRKIKNVSCLIFAIVFFLCATSSSVYADNRKLVVYIAAGSATAYRYHGTQTCPGLSRSVVKSIYLEDAAKKGYTACQRCNPPEPDFEVSAAPRPNTSNSSAGTTRTVRGSERGSLSGIIAVAVLILLIHFGRNARKQ